MLILRMERWFPSGNGIMTYDSGARYEGAFKNGLPNGYGIMTWKNGSWYKGNFKNKLCHGQGKYYDIHNLIEEGEFKNNKFWNGIRYERLNAKWIKNTIENGKSISSEPCAEPELNEEASSMYGVGKRAKNPFKRMHKLQFILNNIIKTKME